MPTFTPMSQRSGTVPARTGSELLEKSMQTCRTLLLVAMATAGCHSETPWVPPDLGPMYRYDFSGVGQLPDLAGINSQPGDGSVITPADLSATSGDLATPVGGGRDMASRACTTYATSTIANMRQAASGCYELDSVVTLAVTPSGTNTRSVSVHVQDVAGGDYSAIKLSCSSSSTAHPCMVLATVKSVLAGRSVTVQGTFIKSSAAKGGFEAFYIDNITDNGAGTAPAPAALVAADVERSTAMSSTGKSMSAYWFQMFSANITDKWVMFDWSAPEFKRTGTSTACPQWFGFGMIPSSAGVTAGAACNGTTQPAGQTAVNAKEILVSTDYSSGFKYSTDCACAAMYGDPIPTAGQGVTGNITALLDYDVPIGQTTGYQYIAPLANASFTIQ
jgi:hypothetical protein